MCSNGGYTERGIKQVDGFMSERWRIEPEYAVRVDPGLGVLGVLLEPTTVVAKAWEHVVSIGRRTFWDPQTVLVVGAGPIGLLGAMIGVQHGGEVHVLDRVDSGPKPALVKELGATYHTDAVADIGCGRTSSGVHRRGRPGPAVDRLRVPRRDRLPDRRRAGGRCRGRRRPWRPRRC